MPDPHSLVLNSHLAIHAKLDALNLLCRAMFLSLALVSCCAASGERQIFLSKARPPVRVDIAAGSLRITEAASGKLRQSFDLQLPDTTTLAIRYINSDNYPDIEVSHTDEGMGTYTIHHLFVYSKFTGTFMELEPTCGDEFLNLQPVKRGALLRYSRYDSITQRWVGCMMRPD